MANKIVVQIPSTVVTANGTTVSEAVALDGKDRNFMSWAQVSARTDGSLVVEFQLSTSPNGPWLTWLTHTAISSVNANISFPPVNSPVYEYDIGNETLLFIRAIGTASGVTNGFTFNAALCCQG